MKAIHPECGKKVEIYKDIIITPFYTEEFCDYLVDTAKYFDGRFIEHIKYKNDTETNNTVPWNTLFMSHISQIMFENFCGHYKKFLVPLINKNFICSGIEGWFSPFIIKYDKIGQNVNLHNDTSGFTMNVKLNTEFEGATLRFPRQEWSNKDIPKGWCFLWPSQVTHPHEADPLIGGVKYTIASWTHPVSWSPNDLDRSILYNDIILPDEIDIITPSARDEHGIEIDIITPSARDSARADETWKDKI